MAYLDENLDLYHSGKKPYVKSEDAILQEHKQEVFTKHYDLASMSYMGGLNSSYLLGLTEGNIIDIDFSSCYPTALSMIQDLTYEPSGSIEEFKDELEKFDGTSL